MAAEVREMFWRARGDGMLIKDAAAVAGVGETSGLAWSRERGGVRPPGPVPRSARVLSLAEREEIAVGLAAGRSQREIARRLGRSPATISRETARNVNSRGEYRAVGADRRAAGRARRPKPARLAVNPELRGHVQDKLKLCWSPEQISRTLAEQFPDRPEMRVSHETIYQSLFIQGRGALRRELTRCLRTGRAVRRPKRCAQARRSRIPDMVMISERPVEVADRAVPGHWEGDLIIGKAGHSQIGTLVERTTRFTMLVHLPDGRDAAQVRDALAATIATLPEQLHGSLTWDQGIEMARHAELRIAADLDIYFCDPHSPWQRGSNENTNGLLRQYFPKGTDLSVHSAEHLAAVAAELNDRPRKTLGWKPPRQALNALIATPAA